VGREREREREQCSSLYEKDFWVVLEEIAEYAEGSQYWLISFSVYIFVFIFSPEIDSPFNSPPIRERGKEEEGLKPLTLEPLSLSSTSSPLLEASLFG